MPAGSLGHRRTGGPYRFPISLCFIYLVTFVARSLYQRRRAERTRLGLCMKCGYNLKVTTTGRCPECGTLPRLETWELWGQWD